MLHKAWNSKGEMPYCFPMSSIRFQGHMVQNITDFDPNWAFPDYKPVAAFKSLRYALFVYMHTEHRAYSLWIYQICVIHSLHHNIGRSLVYVRTSLSIHNQSWWALIKSITNLIYCLPNAHSYLSVWWTCCKMYLSTCNKSFSRQLNDATMWLMLYRRNYKYLSWYDAGCLKRFPWMLLH